MKPGPHNKAATFWGRGSVDFADALKVDLFLSIQRRSQVRLTRSLPIAGVGKVAGLERALFHPECETTPEAIWLQEINGALSCRTGPLRGERALRAARKLRVVLALLDARFLVATGVGNRHMRHEVT